MTGFTVPRKPVMGRAVKIKTIHLKVKSEAWPWLDRAAVEVNQVWNYCREVSDKALEPGTERPNGRWLTGFDLNNLTSGMTSYFEYIGAATIQDICQEYASKRKQFKKRSLKWRSSFGSRRSLGWVPIRAKALKMKGERARFMGKTFRLFNPEYLLAYAERRSGSFSQNSLGEWYLNVAVEIPACETMQTGKSIGLDLGLKTIATGSDGSILEASKFYRTIEPKLAQAQRRGHKRQAKRLHLKAANRRLDALHKFSRKIVDDHDLIVIGDVSPSKLAKTRMAKSVHDAGWGMLKTFLQYKGDYAGKTVLVVNEAYTSRACSNCGSLSGPQGVNGLRVREWECACGMKHDRDVNAARNILNLGMSQHPPSAGMSRAA